AALVHASFQLSVSVLTLLSGHAIGAARSHAKLLRTMNGFIAGAIVMTMLLLASFALLASHIETPPQQTAAWTMACGLLIGIGIAVWLVYFRREQGTTLWIPRGLADHLTARTKATKRSAEAFSLGLTSVLGELLFIIAPSAVSALALAALPAVWQLVGIVAYTVISALPLIIVAGLVGGGHKLSRIQKWRASNKHFLQFAAGSSLIVLAGFIYVFEVLALGVDL